jgi:hypothetical protein
MNRDQIIKNIRDNLVSRIYGETYPQFLAKRTQKDKDIILDVFEKSFAIENLVVKSIIVYILKDSKIKTARLFSAYANNLTFSKKKAMFCSLGVSKDENLTKDITNIGGFRDRLAHPLSGSNNSLTEEEYKNFLGSYKRSFVGLGKIVIKDKEMGEFLCNIADDLFREDISIEELFSKLADEEQFAVI